MISRSKLLWRAGTLSGVLGLAIFIATCGGGEDYADPFSDPIAPVKLNLPGGAELADLSFDGKLAEALRAEQDKDTQAAEAYYLSAVEEAEGYPPSDLRYQNVLKTLGFFYLFNAMAPKAATTFEKLIAVHEERFGSEDLAVAEVLVNLTGAHNILGMFELSLPLYERATAIYEKAEGPKGDHVIQTLEYHADILRKLDRKEEAKALEEKIKTLKGE